MIGRLWERIVDAWWRLMIEASELMNRQAQDPQTFGRVRFDEETDEWIGSCPRCGNETVLNNCVQFPGIPSGIAITCLCGTRWEVHEGNITVTPMHIHRLGDVVRENSPQHEKLALWDLLGEGVCGKCGGGPMLMGPQGGMAMNIKCSVCEQRYWISEIRDFGAYMLT